MGPSSEGMEGSTVRCIALNAPPSSSVPTAPLLASVSGDSICGCQLVGQRIWHPRTQAASSWARRQMTGREYPAARRRISAAA